MKRLALADDAGFFREALARSLTDLGWQVEISVGSGVELLRAMDSHEVDLAVVDVAMPPTRTNEGVQAAATIKAAWPHIGVLLLSAFPATPQAIELLREVSTGVGYLRKEEVADLASLESAIERVLAGELVVDRTLVRRLLAAPSRESQLARLSEQELEVLRLMAEGHANSSIAARMSLSRRTVEDHVGRVFAKLDIQGESRLENKRVLAVLTWLRLTGRTAH